MENNEIGKLAHIGSGGMGKTALLALMNDVTMSLDEIIERDKAYTITSPYRGLMDNALIRHDLMPTIGTRKPQLSKKQRKARSKAKNAKKARKNNRRK
jgi:hypothetical protein